MSQTQPSPSNYNIGPPCMDDASLVAGLQRGDAVAVGLAALTDEQRQVILLHVVEGWELPQVAELLDRSVASVKSAYYRGIQSLRRALARHADPEDSWG